MKKLDKKRKKVRFSIRNQVLFPTLIVVFAMGVIICQLAYLSAKKEIISIATDEALSMAKISASTVDVAAHDKLKPGDEDNIDYTVISDGLKEIQKGSGIKFLYTLKIINGELCYVVDTDETEERCAIGDVLQEEGVREKVMDQGEPWLSDGIITDEWGTAIAAYVPITDDYGNIVAVLGSDYDAEPIMKQINNLRIFTWIIFVVCVSVASLVVVLVLKGLMKKINVVGDKIYDIVNSDGDLTKELESNNKDELGIISGYVNDLLRYIKDVVANINDSAKILNQSVKVSLNNVEETSGGINQVFGEMEQMSASMEETSASLTQIGTIMETMLENVLEMAESANEGKVLTEEIFKRAQGIKDDAERQQDDVRAQSDEMGVILQERIEKSQAVAQIANLTEQILSISSQTNLLALNASIEAARAGDAGKGFAVVADEITQLATNSAQTAEEIRRISDIVIGAVNELAEKSREMLEFLNTKTLEGYEELVNVGQKYQDNSKNINGMMLDFNKRFLEFEESMKEVKDSMEAVSIAVDESTKAIVEVTQTSERLASNTNEVQEDAQKNMEIAHQLENEANKFKIN